MAVYAYERGGATAVGVVVTLGCILRALATPFRSVLGDRYPRRLVMIGSDVTTALLMALAGALIDAVFVIAALSSVSVSPFRAVIGRESVSARLAML